MHTGASTLYRGGKVTLTKFIEQMSEPIVKRLDDDNNLGKGK